MTGRRDGSVNISSQADHLNCAAYAPFNDEACIKHPKGLI
jgi:hypothetical protein